MNYFFQFPVLPLSTFPDLNSSPLEQKTKSKTALALDPYWEKILESGSKNIRPVLLVKHWWREADSAIRCNRYDSFGKMEQKWSWWWWRDRKKWLSERIKNSIFQNATIPPHYQIYMPSKCKKRQLWSLRRRWIFNTITTIMIAG